MRRAFQLLGLLLVLPNARAQDHHRVDSLNALLDGSRKDTVQLELLRELKSMYWGADSQIAINERLGSLAKELMDDEHPAVRAQGERGMLDYLFTLGTQRLNQYDLTGALRSYERGSLLSEQFGNAWGRDRFKVGLMELYTAVGDSAEALRLKQELYADAVADQDTLAMISYFPDTRWSPASEVEIERQLLFFEVSASGRTGAVRDELLFQKVQLLYAHTRYEEALSTINRCVKLGEPGGRLAAHVPVYHNMLGMIYQKLDSLPEADRAYEKCQHAAESMRLWTLFCECTDSLASIARMGHDQRTAERQWLRSLEVATAMNMLTYKVASARRLKELYKEQGRPVEQAAMMETLMAAKDSLDAVDVGKDIMRMKFRDGQRVDSLTNARDRAEARLVAEQQLDRERVRRNIFLFTGLGLLFFGALLYRQRNRIRTERDHSERLLHNILPVEVAEELKANGQAEARHYDNATILFSDFKGFTQASERMSPQELVEELNTCFKAFDGITTGHGIEKIKTIGDAYMCAGGLPDPKTSSPVSVVHAALEMQVFMQQRKAERDALGKPAFEMRVGIHTGPVVAGIVGVKKFAYDIWGDTVNIASRMESSGEVGQVNISESTYQLVKDEPGLAFMPRGKVQAKGKGELEMYFVGREM